MTYAKVLAAAIVSAEMAVYVDGALVQGLVQLVSAGAANANAPFSVSTVLGTLAAGSHLFTAYWSSFGMRAKESI